MAGVKDIHEARQRLRLIGISIHVDSIGNQFIVNQIGGGQSTERHASNLDEAMIIGVELAQSELTKPVTKPKAAKAKQVMRTNAKRSRQFKIAL